MLYLPCVDANTYCGTGNLAPAKTMLVDVRGPYRDQAVLPVQGMALHSRAALAHQLGQKQAAVQRIHEEL